MIELALYQPDIAQNTATILRMAACLGVRVHIIEPAGFLWSTREFKRAGMDYVARADVVRQPGWQPFVQAMTGRRMVLATTRGTCDYTDFRFASGDVVLMGRESSGVPQQVHDIIAHRIVIPMQPGLRSINVAVACAMITGEAMRQTVWGVRPGSGEA